MRQQDYRRRLTRFLLSYTLIFGGFVVVLAFMESRGLPPRWIGYIFLFATIFLYAGIGILSRTADVAEYYVAGRRIPAFFNGMATGADWMSAASFIGLAGTLYVTGYQALAFVMGWTGGFVLVALLLAPYLRKFGQFTIPDFLGARYGGRAVRAIGVAAAIMASFVYVVAQIYGVGIITSRFTGVTLEIGVFVGLAGILVCSFLGGMRAVTWTQVAQYVVLILAYFLPVMMLSHKLTDVPIPQLTYGAVLEKVEAKEVQLLNAPEEISARNAFRRKADEYAARIEALPTSLDEERNRLIRELNELRYGNASARDVAKVQRELARLPRTADEARKAWRQERQEALAKAEPPRPHAKPHPGATPEARDAERRNFIALMFVLMVGTAALPHVLMRYYTTPSVAEARSSVGWSLLFIFLLYITAPAYAVFAKWEIYSSLVGTAVDSLPNWLFTWRKMGMVDVEDINADGILQLAELTLNPDVIVLITPEIAGLPYVVAGLVAAGGLAAALSTADGLLLTITSALSHDVYYKMLNPNASTQRRLVVSKSLLLMVAVFAAYAASLRPDHILFMVGAAFSLAAAFFFPALVLGIFWKRANKQGAIAGMVVGGAVTLGYLVATHPFFGLNLPLLWGIQNIAAGAFGVPAGFITMIVVSLLTPPPRQEIQDLVEYVRYPDIPS